ncbi:necdin-like 2 isoform X1 [Corythoichthys intestinalis]|uniref:necdin-like 2 isoform X1 n=1 Tax=Corythoichthys intestinalis TaxID=161448 RepID=UPI0025A5810A|nr:necdin-like 2 isoform X1 [Corythoichthys intestinalis]
MSQKKRLANTQMSSQRKRLAGMSGSVGNEEELTFTQPSTLPELSGKQIEQKSDEVVQYILMKDQKKIPIRRADLVKHVIKEYRNGYPAIMKRVAHTFEQVFGLTLVNIDPKNQMYILLKKLEEDVECPTLGKANPKTGVLFVILSVIFMKQGVVKELLIWNVLEKLYLNSMTEHKEFGDIKKMVIDEFVRQRYLEYVRVPHTDPLEHNFLWGPRAKLEVSKAKILQFVAELHDRNPQSWKPQYKEAQNQSLAVPTALGVQETAPSDHGSGRPTARMAQR